MEQNDKIQLFEDKRIRTAWDEEKEEWYFSIVDVCEVLSGTDNPRRYWSDLKRKLKSEGAVELYEKIVQLKMTAPDGKKRLTDVADTEQLLRIVQSIQMINALLHYKSGGRSSRRRCDRYALSG